MKSVHFTKIILLLCSICIHFCIQAQAPLTKPLTNDTLRVIEIVKGKNMRLIYIDSTTSLQTIAGGVILKEGNTTFTCDSATINKNTNILEAYGNVHINQSDSIHTYAQYLKYVGKDRIAYLKKEVKLTDKKGILFTQELEYDLKTNIGIYKNGGKVVNGTTVLTSKEGVYYGDTKDVFFKKQVHLVDPKYNIKSDSLQYNTQLQLATFITQTLVKSKDGVEIFTKSGNYDLKNGKAFFGNRTVFKDSTRTYIANNSAIDEASGIAQLEGNAVITDSVNGYTITGNQIFLDRNNNSFLATRKPVLIFKGENNDSTFIAADTLFSGVIKVNANGSKKLIKADTLKKTWIVNEDSLQSDSIINTNTVLVKDTSRALVDSLKSIKNAMATLHQLDSINKKISIDTAANNLPQASGLLKKSINVSIDKKQNNKDSTIRYFIAFHHVKIYNDSVQAVCDSLHFSAADSIFKLFNNPVVYSRKSQISGDTIHLFIKNKKADRVYVFDKAMIINEVNHQLYNQISGRTLNGYFKDGGLDYLKVKGSPAESIFYPQDDDSAFTGMNRCKGDVIDVYFIDKAINKVKFVNDVDGTMYPIKQIPADQKFLKGFAWQDKRRPKNKLELFE